MDPQTYRMFLGKGGQLAVMSHIVTRGLNVALPELDLGNDVFVVQDATGELWPVQVKTATATANRRGELEAVFYLSVKQLTAAAIGPERLVYSLVLFHGERWAAFLNVPRRSLADATAHLKESNGAITPKFRLTDTAVFCGRTQVDLHRYRDDWSYWPDLRPGPTQDARR